MSDEPTIDVQGQATRPEISPEGLDHYKQALGEYERLLSNPATATPEIGQRYAALRQSVEFALAVTGQSLAPSDPRSPAQQVFDARCAMEASPVLVEMVRRDSKATDAPDPQQIAKAFKNTGRSYADALKDAQHAVSSTPALAGVQVEKLPAATLASLAVFGAHHRKFSAQRPG